MNMLFAISMAMVFGLLFNRIVKKIGLPNVTGYLVAGLVIGPYVLGLFPKEAAEQSADITNIALGFIAFSIGGEFKMSSIKQIGGSVLTITFFQALAATIFVDIALIVAGFPVPLSITLGAIATATAPAATLMVVRQYRAKGPVTNILLPVVALDDAVGLVVFSVSLALAQVFASGAALTAEAMLVEPLIEIVGSLVIGGAIGLGLAFCLRFFKSNANRLCLVITVVFLGTALSGMLGLSSLLLSMATGAALANLRNDSEKVLEINDNWTQPLFLLFFVISGAELDVAVVPTVGLLGIIYIVMRSLGKYFGARIGATVVKADHNIRKYLGVALLPQAGVAIGMSQIVISALPQYGNEIRAVVLCATLVYELIGPLLTKMVLTKAGEIEKTAKMSTARSAHA